MLVWRIVPARRVKRRDWNEVDDMSGLRVVTFWLVLLALVSSVFMLGVLASDVDDEAVSAVVGAEQAVAEAYGAVLEAEEAGADVSGLLDQLDVAGKHLALARMCLGVGDFDGAVENADLCVEALEGIVWDAVFLRREAVRESGERSWMAIGGSVVGVVVVTAGCWFGWGFFKKRYYRRVLNRRPEVLKGES